MGGFWLFAVNWHWWIHYIGLYNSLRKPFSKFLSGSWHALVRLGDCLVFTSGESGEIKFHEQFLFNSIDRNTYDKIPGIQIQVSLLWMHDILLDFIDCNDPSKNHTCNRWLWFIVTWLKVFGISHMDLATVLVLNTITILQPLGSSKFGSISLRLIFCHFCW